MAKERTRSAIVCAIVVTLGLATFASAQETEKKPEISSSRLTQVRLNASSIFRQTLLKAKARPEALRLRESFRNKIAAARVDLAAIDRSAVPVLVSARASLVQNLRVFSKLDRYTASTRQDGSVIEINGTRLPVQAPKNFRLPATIKTMRMNFKRAKQAATEAADDALEDVRIDHTGSGVDVSFTRFGSVYNLSIDCGEAGEGDPEAIGPAPDAAPNPAAGQCTDDNALGIAKELEVIGGGETAQ